MHTYARIPQTPQSAAPDRVATPARVTAGQHRDAVYSILHAYRTMKVYDAFQSPGQPIDPETRAFMEPRFGYDFSQVRVHSDEKAAHAASLIGARASAVGDHIVFGVGEYAPGLEAGRRVIAHELAHVVQQRIGGDHGAVPGSPAMEQEAARAARAVCIGRERAAVSGAAFVGLALLPRSLGASRDPSRMTFLEIEQEIFEIRQWLAAHPENSADRQWLLGALRSLEDHMPGVTAGLPIDREQDISIVSEGSHASSVGAGHVSTGMGFASRFNSEFRSVLHSLGTDAPRGQVSQNRLWYLFTPAQREKLADFMVTRRVPERLFNGADDIGHANAQQRILISAHILTHGTYRPGSFEQRVHARYCGHWVQIVHQYAGVTPASGSWPEGLAGRGVMGSFDPMGAPVLGAGQAQPIFGGARAPAEDLPIPEETGHARTAAREEEQLARDPTARRRVHRRTQFGMERFGELRAGDWLYLYNANESASGQHSVIFSRWVDEGEVQYLEGIPYRSARVFNQPSTQSGGREQTLLLGDDFAQGQRANPALGIPYRPQIDAITLVVRVSPSARPASTPAELLPSPGGTRASRLSAENDRHIRAQERRLRRPVDRNLLKQWLRGENAQFITSLGELVTVRERRLLVDANRSDQIEDLVRLYQRLSALSVNAMRMARSRRSTFEGLAGRHAEAQARLDLLRERTAPEQATIVAEIATAQARMDELERIATPQRVREAQQAIDVLSRQIQRLPRGEERTTRLTERGTLRQSLVDLRRQRQAERAELQRLRRRMATLRRRQTAIQGQLSAAERRLPFGLLPGRPRGEDPGVITGRLRDLRPPWRDFTLSSSSFELRGE